MPLHPRRRAAALACCLLGAAVLAGACRHDGETKRSVSDPDPPSSDEGRQRTMDCITLAEALYSASAPRQVIARSSRSLRLHADDEALAPLLSCLARATQPEAGAVWPEAAVRSLANAYAAALSTSRMSVAEVRQRLTENSARPDITLFWSARLTTTDPAEQEALLREAARANPDNPAASLALSLLLVEQRRPDDAAAVESTLPPDERADLRAFVQGAVAAARGERHQASALLEALARGAVSSSARDGGDALALRLLKAPSPAPLLCEVGRAHEGAGERDDALRSYRAGECFDELTTLHLTEGDAFSALLTSFWASAALQERALASAGAARLLADKLEARLRSCASLLGGERCEEHRRQLERLKPPPGATRAGLAPVRRRAEASFWVAREDGPALPAREVTVLVDPGADACADFTALGRVPREGGALYLGATPLAPGACERSALAYRLMLVDDDGGRRGPLEVGLPLTAQLFFDAERPFSVTGEQVSVRGWRFPQDDDAQAAEPRLVPIVLEASLSELLADADGDGLPDLEERWLATDPTRADTDYDGVRDDVDTLPLGSHGSDDDDEVLRRALGVLLFDDEGALFDRDPRRAGPVLFVHVPRAFLRDRPGARVIELVGTAAAEDWVHAGAGRGGALVDVAEVVADATGTRVLVQALQGVRAPVEASDPWRACEDTRCDHGIAPARGGLALVEKTAQGWRAVRFTREMALSPRGR